MRRVLICFAVILINLAAQTSLFPYIEINGIRPDSALILAVSYGILRGDAEGGVFGFFAGLLQDIFFGKFLGLNALLGMLTGFFCGKPFKDFYSENYLIPLLLVPFASLFSGLVFFMAARLFSENGGFAFYFSKIILPETIYNAAACVPIYAALYAVNKNVENYEKTHNRMF
jgi:rod shape-determining protein MreD